MVLQDFGKQKRQSARICATGRDAPGQVALRLWPKAQASALPTGGASGAQRCWGNREGEETKRTTMSVLVIGVVLRFVIGGFT